MSSWRPEHALVPAAAPEGRRLGCIKGNVHAERARLNPDVELCIPCRPVRRAHGWLQILGGDVAGVVEEGDEAGKVRSCLPLTKPCTQWWHNVTSVACAALGCTGCGGCRLRPAHTPPAPPSSAARCPRLHACLLPTRLPQFKKGDKVFCLTPGFFNATPEGCYAEYVAAEADWVARVPDALPLDKVGPLGGRGQEGCGCGFCRVAAAAAM